MTRVFILAFLFAAPAPAAAQQPLASLDQLAATPLVTVQISEQLRAPPDEATLTVSSEGKAATAKAALAESKRKTEQLLITIRTAGIAAKDTQTEGLSISADFQYENVNGRANQRLIGYVARNSVRIKTKQIDRLTGLLDALTGAGATGIYGPTFAISDPLPLRREARRRAMVRGEAEAGEYARNAGFARVRLLSVQEGVSYQASDIIVTAMRPSGGGAPPPPPPPAPERDGSIAPGQIETGVTLTLQYRMER